MTSNLLWLIPALPLAGFAVNGLLSLGAAGTRHGASKGIVATIAVLMPALAFLVTLACAARISGPGVDQLAQPLWQWLAGGGFDLRLGLLFDRLSSMMLLFITGIGTLIHLYSIGYMWEDRGFARFMAYLNLFMFSMIVLVLGDSLPATFLGWEGVGLCSYLLIGFWHQEHANNDAARKAFIVNRIGDLGFLLGAFALYAVLASAGKGSLLYADIAAFLQNAEFIKSLADPANPAALGTTALLTAAAALIFLGCTGKSAQIPLLTWLPDAMAGPTPVSALIHAATMVTSGVYLVARLGDLFTLTPLVLQAMLLIGCATALYGAIAGLVQQDIKKILAYSTVSQLGFMFMAAGVGAYDVALFHVFTHAFFKATLFLGAGSVIHALHHEQDVRRMGGLSKLLPLTHQCMFLAWLAIIGAPLTSGFMSKDLILERLLLAPWPGPLIGALAIVIALLTAVYMSRLMFLVFWSPTRLSPEAQAHVHEAPFSMLLPVILLAFGSMVAGAAWFELLDIHSFAVWLSPVLHLKAPEHHLNPWLVPVLGTAAAVLGWWVARFLWRGGPRGGTAAVPLTGFADSWTNGLDRAYDLALVRPLRGTAWMLSRVVDQAVLGNALRRVGDLAQFLGDVYTWLQRPHLRSSLAFSLVGAIAILLALLLPVLWKPS